MQSLKFSLKVELQSGLGRQSIAKSMRRQTSSGRCSAVSRSIHKSKTWVNQSRQRSFQWYLGFENRSTNDAAVPLTLAARSLRSIAKSMRRQTSSGRCSAVSRSIHKSKTCSFGAGKDLSNDILVLKNDWKNDAAVPLTLQSGLSLRSIVKLMRRQTSSESCSAVSRSIHQSKLCSFRAGKDLSSDIFGLKID